MISWLFAKIIMKSKQGFLPTMLRLCHLQNFPNMGYWGLFPMTPGVTSRIKKEKYRPETRVTL